MKTLKKLVLSILLIVLAMGLGGAIYIVKDKYFSENELDSTEQPFVTEEPTAAPTEEPDLRQYVITTDSVNIRQEPNTESTIVAEVEKDTVLQLLYGDTEWSSVVYEGQNVYVNNQFITAYTPPVEGENKGAGKTIVIDAGCQKNTNSDSEPIGPDSSITRSKATSGFVGTETGKAEYELNLEIVLKLKAQLESFGYTVVLTRDNNDVDISNSERANVANSSNANVFISIRANSSADTEEQGVVAVCSSINNPYNSEIYSSSYKLANALSNEISISTGAVNSGVWQNDSQTIINWSDIPVSIIQVGYLSNSAEESKLVSEDYQNKIADGIVSGLDAYFAQ